MFLFFLFFSREMISLNIKTLHSRLIPCPTNLLQDPIKHTGTQAFKLVNIKPLAETRLNWAHHQHYTIYTNIWCLKTIKSANCNADFCPEMRRRGEGEYLLAGYKFYSNCGHRFPNSKRHHNYIWLKTVQKSSAITFLGLWVGGRWPGTQ